MTKNIINTKRGFTIIEVVLVLAIAGLIFLMVFVALPNMQAAQRNTQRRNDYSQLATSLTTYVSNNNGSMPTSGTNGTSNSVKKTWLNSNGTDPDGEDYEVTLDATTCSGKTGKCLTVTSANTGGTVGTATKVSRNKNQVVVVEYATCGTNSGTSVDLNAATGKRTYAIVGYVEDGANTASVYCYSGNA